MKTEIRLLPIYSCRQCDYIGKEVIAETEFSKGRYTTFCTHLAGKTMTIKHGEKETPEHYIFPSWCLLKKE